MLRHKPKLTYKGLTVVLSNPSRADKINLLSAGGGRLFDRFIQPQMNRMMCDIRLKEDKSPLLDGTKCILLLGSAAAADWLRNTGNTLGEIRGSVYEYKGVPAIASFFPQDAADIKDYESEFNPQDTANTSDTLDENESESAKGEKSRHGRTKRQNYTFWLSKDIEKCKKIIANNGTVPHRPFEPNYIIYPKAEDAIKELTTHKNEYFYIDIETDPDINIMCFSFAFSSTRGNIYIVPCLLPDYSLAYSQLHLIYRAIAIALRDNITVAHNGASFDFFVFAHKYHIPIYRVYDTMIAQHRCFPEVEKSLGHCTSLWTYEPFHKDEGSVGYGTMQNAKQLWQYCGKDVFTMILIHDAIEAYAKRVPGLRESIDQAMASIRPYLITTLTGIRYDQERLLAIMKENDRLMMQYLRCIRLLIGPVASKELARKSSKGMPGSNSQCCHYFHTMLEYPVITYGKLTKKGTRNPSLAKDNLYKLRLRFDNPVIEFCLAYRNVQHESGMLKFNPWKEDDTN